MGLPPLHFFTEIYLIHGHRCPMSTLGGRLGFAARQRLASRAPLTATYYIATCAADGISVMTGCNKADGSLHIVPQERHALWLQDGDGRGLFAELSQQALQLAGGYRTLDQELLKDEARLSATEQQERQRTKELFLNELLQKFWTLPDEELMNFAATLPADLAGARD